MGRAGSTWVALALTIAAGPTQAEIVSTEHLKAYADFRLRLESDDDSQTAAGDPRQDRTRMRVRARVGLRYEPNARWRAEFRLRSGQEESQQSPHITILDFDDNDTGDASFNLDRWYLRGQTGKVWAWAGRDRPPVWKQNEELLDDDVTAAGIAAGSEHALGPGKLSWSAGYFSAPVGMRAFSGNLGLAQVAYQPKLGSGSFAFALGSFRYDADPQDPDGALLLQNNGSRDYSIVELSAQGRWTVHRRPLTIGGDLFRNLEAYRADDPDPVTAANFDQTDGYVLQGSYGSLDVAGAWQVAVAYVDIELFAVNNSYAQDDSVRWGNATQTRASGRRGHELRYGWAFSGNSNLIARWFAADAIDSVEDGTRLRLDFNHTF